MDCQSLPHVDLSEAFGTMVRSIFPSSHGFDAKLRKNWSAKYYAFLLRRGAGARGAALAALRLAARHT